MKYTLLDLTQSILASMSSDEVNSVGDTTESLQVAEIIRQKYFDIINRVPLPEHEQLIQLEASADTDSPVLMFVPDGIANIAWLKYYNSNVLDNAVNTSTHGVNTDITTTASWSTSSSSSITIGTGTKVFTVSSGLTINTGDSVLALADVDNYMTGTVTSYAGVTLTLNITATVGSGTFTSWSITQDTEVTAPPGYQLVHIIPVKDFISIVNDFDPASSDIQTFTFSDSSHGFPGTFTFAYRNDKQPQYCCIINNYYVIFDSYDNTQDDTLQRSKTMAWGRVIPTFRMEDSFIPDLAEEQFQLLLNEAKALAFFELKQQPHQLAIQETKRGWSNVQKNKAVANRPGYFDELPNFGRGNRWGKGSAVSYFKLRGFDR